MKVLLICWLIGISALNVYGEVLNPEPEIVEREEIKVVGYLSLISMKHNLISNLWMRFVSRIEEIENVINPNEMLGISYDGEQMDDDYLFFHLVGYEVSEIQIIPEGLTYVVIPPHQYAKFTHKGEIDKLMDTYNYIYGEWMATSGYEIDEDFYEIELYDQRFKMGQPDSEFDIYIPIK